ncbi:MAG TPA: hypothetical protein VEP67_06160 [Thiobacillaceae bacterium]|nr:hypothetical protein [Thiobacillaceae bacterium]
MVREPARLREDALGVGESIVIGASRHGTGTQHCGDDGNAHGSGWKAGPILGFFAGWAVLVASAVSGTIPAATVTLRLAAACLGGRLRVGITFLAAGWLLAANATIVKGIKPRSYAHEQNRPGRHKAPAEIDNEKADIERRPRESMTGPRVIRDRHGVWRRRTIDSVTDVRPL